MITYSTAKPTRQYALVGVPAVGVQKASRRWTKGLEPVDPQLVDLQPTNDQLSDIPQLSNESGGNPHR